MSIFEAILLGIIQGLTEFLPVSSSGHLQLVQLLLGFQNLDQYILFNLVCHIGTLLALLYGFRSQIQETLFHSVKRNQILIAILPLFPLLLIMKPIKAIFNQPHYLGYCFLVTSLLLFMGEFLSKSKTVSQLQENRWRDSLVIGLFQALAIVPGISRSGSTISAGRLLGWSLQDAIVFSFLLSIPTILGGLILESRHLFDQTGSPVNMHLSHYLAGLVVSFMVGSFGLALLMKLAAKNRFVYFAWYCLLVGMITIYFFI